jgi:hypothetical protein
MVGIIDAIKNIIKPPAQKPTGNLTPSTPVNAPSASTPSQSQGTGSGGASSSPAKSSGGGGGGSSALPAKTDPSNPYNFNFSGTVEESNVNQSTKAETPVSTSYFVGGREVGRTSGGGDSGRLQTNLGANETAYIETPEQRATISKGQAIVEKKQGGLSPISSQVQTNGGESKNVYAVTAANGFDFPQRYNRPIGSAIKESFKNIFNVGIIGQQGVKAYTQQAFFSPFEYVGNPNQKISYNMNPVYRGTEITNKDFVPEQYKSTKGTTEFQYYKSQSRIIYTSLGLDYKGEPASLASLRLSEKINADLGKTYSQKLSQSNVELQSYYQGKINTGELSLSDAQAQYKSALDVQAKNINIEYGQEASRTYSSKLASSNLLPNIQRVETFKAQAFEPPAYPIIRTTGKVVETGALIGATAFGGSGVTFLASAYIGAKTASSAIQYAGDFSQLSTSQKITGGAGLALGAAATYFTARLGVTKFYREWRSDIYSDLYSQPAKVSGRVIETTPEFTRYATLAQRQIGTSQSSTIQNTQVFPTGESRVGIFAKGKTYTRIFEPQSEKFLTTTEKFTITGKIPKTDLAPVFRSKGIGVQYDDRFGGTGNALYYKEGSLNPLKFSFNAVSKDAGDFYAVAGGKVYSKEVFTFAKNGKVFASSTPKYSSSLDYYGKIGKQIVSPDVNYIAGTGKKSSADYFSDFYETVTYKQLGASASTATTVQSQDIVLSGLASQQISRQASRSISFSEAAYQAFSQQSYATQITEQRSLLPSLSAEASKLSQKQNLVVVPAITTAISAREGQLTIPNIAQQQPQLNEPVTTFRPNLIVPATPTIPNLTGGGGGGALPFYKFNFDDLGLSSNIVKGGKKRVGYTPSFTALIYKIKGTYKPTTLAKTGLDFRPITKGFRINRGAFRF